MTEAVKVTQADRDLVFEVLGGGSYADMIVRGEADFDQFVQRIAVFRIAAATRMREQIIAEAHRSLRLVQGCLECSADDEWRWRDTIKWLEELT